MRAAIEAYESANPRERAIELAVADAYRAGAEMMRERAAQVAEKHWCGDAALYGVPAAIRALPVE